MVNNPVVLAKYSFTLAAWSSLKQSPTDSKTWSGPAPLRWLKFNNFDACLRNVWNSVASDHELVAKAFKAPWRLNDAIGKPVSGSVWRDNGIGKFAISHRVVRGDTVASLALKYSVQIAIQSRSSQKWEKDKEKCWWRS
uniref:LysM domain-containing protein n=1 Tax=Fagus sylvatica TaxID=28930 RepID=A0A2N9EHJ3_FAGSY